MSGHQPFSWSINNKIDTFPSAYPINDQPPQKMAFNEARSLRDIYNSYSRLHASG